MFKKHSGEYKLLSKSKEFNKKWYLQTYPDVAKAKVDPIEHYINHGWKEGRNPGPTFNTVSYLTLNPDVRNANINTYVNIPSARAIDILAFETTLSIKVLSPDKKVVYTSNTGEGTSLKIEQYGTYYVYYTGSDDVGNPLTQLKIITVLDDIAPTITLEKEIATTAKLNDTITLPNITVSDNVSSSEKITTLIFTIDPNNVMKVVNSNIVKFDVKGTYTIRYFAIDEGGNVAYYDVLVEVK